MWAHLWPWRVEEEIPIGHITNGVHTPTWLAWQMQQLYDRHFPPNWMQRMGEPDVWQNIYTVDPGELWETHNALKNLMLTFVRRRVSRQCRRRGESEDVVEAARNILDPNALTIGFARRFATYKRANLLLRDKERILALLNDKERPVQMIFAGKAHPADEPGKQLIQRHCQHATRIPLQQPDRVRGGLRHQRLPPSDPGCGRVAEQSSTPPGSVRHQRPEDGAQRGLNLSILDGWWAEAYDGSNGFAIGRGSTHVSQEVTDQRDTDSLFSVLEEQVVPTFYDRDVDGLPRKWIRMMMNSIATLGWRFSAHRMVMDYTRACYIPAAGGLSCEMNIR